MFAAHFQKAVTVELQIYALNFENTFLNPH